MPADNVAHPTSHDSLEKIPSPSQNGHVNANKSPWSAPDTATGKIENPTISKALSTISVEDFKHIHQKPCVRDALLVGISIGFGAGGIRASLGGGSSLRLDLCFV
jgi:cytochrome c oxidase assembly protein subunit 20